MHPPGIDVNAGPHAVRLLLPVRLPGVPQRQFPSDDEVRRQAGVGVWLVVIVSVTWQEEEASEGTCPRKFNDWRRKGEKGVQGYRGGEKLTVHPSR